MSAGLVLDAAALALVHVAWQGCVAAVLVWMLLRLAGPAPAWRYRIALGGLWALAAAPAVTWLVLVRAALGGSAAAVDAAPSVGPMPLAAGDPVGAARAVLPLWVAGTALLLGRSILARRFVHRSARDDARPLGVAVLEQGRALMERLGVRAELIASPVPVPATLGWRRPLVLLPAAAAASLPLPWSRALLAHELVHVRHHDYLVNLAQVAAEAVLWFHPAAWWLSRQARTERENRCDDDAVALTGDRAAYLRVLAAFEAARATPGSLVGANGAPLLRRARRLAQPAPRAPLARVAATLVAAAFAGCIATAAGARLVVASAATLPAPDAPVVHIDAHDPAGAFTVRMRGRRVLAASIDGVPVRPDRLHQRGDSLRILDARGEALLAAQVRPGGLSWAARPARPRS